MEVEIEQRQKGLFAPNECDRDWDRDREGQYDDEGRPVSSVLCFKVRRCGRGVDRWSTGVDGGRRGVDGGRRVGESLGSRWKVDGITNYK